MRRFFALGLFSVASSLPERIPLGWSLDSLFDNARSRAGSQDLCTDGPNFFLARTSQGPPAGMAASEYSALDAVLFNHPLARVILLLVGIAPDDGMQSRFDSYLADGYCVVVFPLRMDLIMTLVYRAAAPMDELGFSDEQLQDSLGRVGVEPNGLVFTVNSGVLALQVLFGGVSLSMDIILLNPFDSWLPGSLSLARTAVFLERPLEPDGPLPSQVLEEEDFEKSWTPRSHTDRGDGITTVCASHVAPRSLPQGCGIGKQLLRESVAMFVRQRSVAEMDTILTRLYKAYVRSRRRVLSESCEVVLLPSWSMAEPHFPDGFRYYGRRGLEDELDDRPHHHSQLYSSRAHKERADWSLIRSLKLFLPMDYGPPSARNVLPRSVVDLTRRMLSLHLGPFAGGPMQFGVPPKLEATQGRRLRSPVDTLDALQNSMMESFDAGQPKTLPREAALPGDVGGYRTFRDVRVVGLSTCHGTQGEGGHQVQLMIGSEGTPPKLRFFCRPGARVEGSQKTEGYDTPDQVRAFRICRQALSVDQRTFRFRGLPAQLNAAISVLAFEPLPGQSPGQRDSRLTEAELLAHFDEMVLTLEEHCPAKMPATKTIRMQALLDDVQDHITVVAHSASRCDLLDRLGASFRSMYEHLPVLVTCECAEGIDCQGLKERPHPSVSRMFVIDVPYDFGLSRGKKLLVHRVQTEFLLVLDDDFVRSPLSCLECMLWHMRSQLHSLTLPFDLLGFPILEDERNFGAFRGQLRATSNRLYLDPMTAAGAPDGCTRVGIHPMAFLGRVARLRGFKFQDNLRVGEHEQFFYSNRYLGLQAAVCFDSTFPHFRVKMKGEYKQRRDRMQELMTKEFTKVGFPSMMYLLQKYDMLSATDHNEFISKDVPPWQISDDTCGPQPDPPVEFGMFFAAVFSSATDTGMQFRRLLRGEEEQATQIAWLPRLAELAAINWAFFLDEAAAEVPSVVEEEAEFGDIVYMPSAGQPMTAEPSSEQLRWTFAFLQRFQFRWLVIVQEDAFVNVAVLLGKVSEIEQASGNAAARTVIGHWQSHWQPPGLSPVFFALSQDVFHLLASKRMVKRLRTDLEGGPGAAVSAWLEPLALHRESMPGVYTGRRLPSDCPLDATVLHPIGPADFLVLSEASLQGPPCEVLAHMQRQGVPR
eukprot:s3343_g4.t1